MPKGQQRGNRELKKPKANKKLAIAPPVSALVRKPATADTAPKKKT